VQVLNDFRPWGGTLRGEMAMAELIACDTLSAEGAAALWWTIERGASVFVAAGPPGAGKSTVANALLEFLPRDAAVYATAGGRDRLEVPDAPGPVYLLVNELSGHMPLYLYGGAAQRAFALLDTGMRMLGTLHARSAAEAVRVMCYEAEIARDEIRVPFVFAVISAGWVGREIVRRVVELGFLAPDGELTSLTTFDADELRLHSHGVEALATWSGLDPDAVHHSIAQRAEQLATPPFVP
jgi:type IV secretory pathway ATPase VirB11/archaellum biosynthesis ATPase